VHGFSIGSSVEAVRFGRLFPQQPYTVQVNTFHVPSVESTLLRTFSKGTHYVRSAAPLVFSDTLRQTHLRMPPLEGYVKEHLTTLPSLKWTLDAASIIWKPKLTEAVLSRPASAYSLLLALYWRVNGASHLYGTVKSKDENLREKVREFIDAHVLLAMRIDALDDPSNDLLLPEKWADMPSLGPTEWLDDRDLIINKARRILALEATPFEVLGIDSNTRCILGQLAAQIRENPRDDDLEAQFNAVCPKALDYYYALPKKNAAEMRAHSWYLACLLVINQSWGHVRTHQLALAEGERHAIDPVANRTAYAHHRVMGAFVPLMHAVIGTNAPHSDDAWRPRLDGKPSYFDLHFPDQTTCFHAGDLPALDALFDQVGLFGVQAVKAKIPLVRLMIKALPICCQSRDLLQTLCDGVPVHRAERHDFQDQ